jgi:hypothetical protein
LDSGGENDKIALGEKDDEDLSKVSEESAFEEEEEEFYSSGTA